MPASSTTRETRLLRAVRLPSSVNGNPRFRLVCLDADYVTMSDAACSYDVENIARRIPSDANTALGHSHGLPVRLHLTRAGRVWNIEQVQS